MIQRKKVRERGKETETPKESKRQREIANEIEKESKRERMR
jgi:hypothetical protein